MSSKRLSEFFLLLLILYTAVFLWNDHVGYLLSSIMSVVVLAILIISYLVELIEPSKVPVGYFRLMWILFFAPLTVLIFFGVLRMVY